MVIDWERTARPCVQLLRDSSCRYRSSANLGAEIVLKNSIDRAANAVTQGYLSNLLKGIVHPKMTIMSLINLPHVVPNP